MFTMRTVLNFSCLHSPCAEQNGGWRTVSCKSQTSEEPESFTQVGDLFFSILGYNIEGQAYEKFYCKFRKKPNVGLYNTRTRIFLLPVHICQRRERNGHSTSCLFLAACSACLDMLHCWRLQGKLYVRIKGRL